MLLASLAQARVFHHDLETRRNEVIGNEMVLDADDNFDRFDRARLVGFASATNAIPSVHHKHEETRDGSPALELARASRTVLPKSLR